MNSPRERSECEAGEPCGEAGCTQPADSAVEVRLIWELTEAPPAPDDRAVIWRRIKRGARRPWARRARGLLLAAAIAGIATAVATMAAWERVRVRGADMTVTVPAGATAALDLGPGIAVRINSATQLVVTDVSSRRIGVRLAGEAYFDVEPNGGRVLVIETAEAVVRNTGTEFNVRTRDGRTDVVVVEGAVEFEAGGRTVQVRAGEGSRAVAGGRAADPAVADLFAARAWLDGLLVFDRTPLAAVAAEFERRFGVPLEVDAVVRGERLTAVIRSTTPGAAMEAICAVVGARCASSSHGWVLSAP